MGVRRYRKDWRFEEFQESGISQGCKIFATLTKFRRVAKIRNPCKNWPSTRLKITPHQKTTPTKQNTNIMKKST